jgi:ferredoxin
MRIVVDLNRCLGYAQCVHDSQRQRVLRAAASCPVQAILVERLDATEEGTTS